MMSVEVSMKIQFYRCKNSQGQAEPLVADQNNRNCVEKTVAVSSHLFRYQAIGNILGQQMSSELVCPHEIWLPLFLAVFSDKDAVFFPQGVTNQKVIRSDRIL